MRFGGEKEGAFIFNYYFILFYFIIYFILFYFILFIYFLRNVHDMDSFHQGRE